MNTQNSTRSLLLKAVKAGCGFILDIIYPRMCEVCGRPLLKSESVMCLQCRADMPLTDIHLSPFNDMHRRLASLVPIEKCAAYFYYDRGAPYTRLIHSAKYNGRPYIARELARRFARRLIADNFFDDIDILLPVPMYFWKEVRRGYNQTVHIARGLSSATDIPIGYNLKAVRSHRSQTRSGTFSRWINTSSIYEVTDADRLRGLHVAIVDDVITTGATLLHCCEAVHRAVPSAKISVITLAIARLS